MMGIRVFSMKYVSLLAFFALAFMTGACNNDVTVGNGNRNEVKDVSVGHNIGNNSPAPTKVELQEHSSSLRVYCETESSGSPVVMGHMGSNDKGLMRLITGTEYYGFKYPVSVRCDQIVQKTNKAILLGATGWKAEIKNKMPVICAAQGNKKNSKCMEDENGNILEIATFQKGTNIVKLAEQFEVLTSSASVSVGSGIIDNSPSYYMDFKEAINKNRK
jgi:hypothetical protein